MLLPAKEHRLSLGPVNGSIAVIGSVSKWGRETKRKPRGPIRWDLAKSSKMIDRGSWLLMFMRGAL